jgi:hypothetical protein
MTAKESVEELPKLIVVEYATGLALYASQSQIIVQKV